MRSFHPVFAFVEDSHGTATPIEFRSTCIELAEGAVLTAAHVVAPPIDDSQWLGVAMLDSDRLETHAVTLQEFPDAGNNVTLLLREGFPGVATAEQAQAILSTPVPTPTGPGCTPEDMAKVPPTTQG